MCVLSVLDVLDAVICVVTELASIGTGTRLISAKVGEEKDTAILYWTYRAELTNDPSLGVNQKMNDSEAACCSAEALGLLLCTTGCATGKQ